MFQARATFCGMKLRTFFTALATAGALMLAGGGQPSWAGQAQSVGQAKVDRLLGKMSLQEKIRMVHGEWEPPATAQGQAGYMAGNPKLGIPWLRLADGPPGVLTRHRSTAPTATMGLGATFSPEDARLNGIVIGRDARALGINIALQPFINVMRDPTWGRAYNLFGEDPLLVGEIGAAEVKGIQSQGTMAQAKHYIAYNSGSNVLVGQQALHEIYAAPFAAVVKAGVGSIMCSYNRINGAYSCGNSQTLKTLLRQEIGFKGWVNSDWGATHATTFINEGLDMEMPGYQDFWITCYFCAEPPASSDAPHSRRAEWGEAEGMLPAIKAGHVKPERITAAARQILLEEERFGWLGKNVKHSVTAVPFDEDVKIVEKTAEDAAVLLKNDDHALPLTPRDLESVALVGPGAGQTITVGRSGEKALGFPSRDLSPLAALKQATAGVPHRHITYAVADDMTGSPIPAARFSHDGQPGLSREDTHGKNVGTDPILDFTKKSGHALPPGSSFTWRGTLDIPTAGDYWVNLQLMGCSAQLKIDGKLVGQSSNLFEHGYFIQAGQDNVLPTTDNLDNVRRKLHLTAGAHSLEVTEQGDGSAAQYALYPFLGNNPWVKNNPPELAGQAGGSGRPVQIRLNWVTPREQQLNYQAALNAARYAKTVVVFAWSQGRPRFGLPGDQNKLISDIAKINPNTIVVLNTSLPSELPWLGQVKALLEMWYPGDGGGVATANVLLGRADPAGRLPFTWAECLDQYASHDPAHPERSARGVDRVTKFSEGIFMGYRWFDEQHIRPLFPFGYGLSYTQFRYSRLHVAPAPDGGLTVRFSVLNTGKVAGDEVAQVYLGAPEPAPAGAQFAVRALAGFDRIGLKAGASREVQIHVPLRQLQYWSVALNGWQLAPGRRTVYVGASSRDLRLEQQVAIPWVTTFPPTTLKAMP